MGLRKGHCYARIKRAFTRHSRVKNKDYIKAIPANKIVRYDMGDPTKSYQYRLDLISKWDMQIRHNALEATRQLINRHLHNTIGLNYFLKLRRYPHHVLRENKMITGAGADRMQKGMQLAFGRAISLATQVKTGSILFSIYTNKEFINKAKAAMERAHTKLPGKYSISIEEIK